MKKTAAYNIDLHKQITSHPSVEAIKQACEATDYRTEIEVVQGNKREEVSVLCAPGAHIRES